MATTRVYRFFVLLLVALALSAPLHLATGTVNGSLASLPILPAGDSPHIGG